MLWLGQYMGSLAVGLGPNSNDELTLWSPLFMEYFAKLRNGERGGRPWSCFKEMMGQT